MAIATQEQIDKEIEILTALMAQSGTHRQEMMNAELEILRGEADPEDFLDEDDEDSERFSYAMGVQNWMTNTDGYSSPSTLWAEAGVHL